jgi:hypothetical protein
MVTLKTTATDGARALARRGVVGFFVAAVAFLAPAAAQAELTFAGSLGTGWRGGDASGRIQSNVMLAPGIELIGELVRFEVGFQGDFPDVQGSDVDVQIRPMLVLQPVPIIYGRVTTGVTQVVSGEADFAFGLSVGLKAPIAPEVSLFTEAGFVPRLGDGVFYSVFEGRVGIGFGF